MVAICPRMCMGLIQTKQATSMEPKMEIQMESWTSSLKFIKYFHSHVCCTPICWLHDFLQLCRHKSPFSIIESSEMNYFQNQRMGVQHTRNEKYFIGMNWGAIINFQKRCLEFHFLLHSRYPSKLIPTRFWQNLKKGFQNPWPPLNSWKLPQPPCTLPFLCHGLDHHAPTALSGCSMRGGSKGPINTHRGATLLEKRP